MSALVLMMLAQMSQPMQRWMPNQDNGSPAFFEFAPASGAGMGTACACTAITGAKGEAMTFARTGAATCSPLGLATTGITNASLVECSANLPRVESSGSVLGLRVEGARTNVLTRFIDYANATWADVSTPTLTGAQASPWTGTYANLAVQFDDNNAAAFEGRTQTVTVTAATAYIMSCYVKAGTLDTARLSLDGTTADFTGLSSTTWSIITVADASSSGVAIAAQALNGSTVGATGTVIWGGCQVEAGAYATSMIPTVAAGVTRGAEAATLPVAVSQQTQCQASNVELLGTSSNDRIWTMTRVLSGSGDFIASYTQAAARVDTVGSGAVSVTGAGSAFGAVTRFLSTWNGSTLTMFRNATQTGTTTTANTLGPASIIGIGSSPAGASHVDGIVTRVQVDPSPSRCTP